MRPRILLAHDNPTVRRLIERTFADQGIDVVVAGGGARAIAAAVEAARPDIVLTGIGDGDPDGSALSALVEQDPALAGIPVVLMRNADEPVDEVRLRLARRDGVLTIPLDGDQVSATVRALLARKGAGGHGGADATDPLEAYFDRLDAAFTSLSAGRGPEPGGGAPPGRSHGPHDPAWPSADVVAGHDPSDGSWPFANAFVSLFAPESGRPSDTVAVSDELIDEIVRRVLARLGEQSMRQLVLDTAERIVREEIDRIRQASGSGPHTAG
jgi:CheY-like chemotaxis protein